MFQKTKLSINSVKMITKKSYMKHYKIFLFTLICSTLLVGHAVAFNVNFFINGKPASSLKDGTMNLELGEKVKLGYFSLRFDKPEWFVKYENCDESSIDLDNFANFRNYIPGKVNLRLQVKRTTWRLKKIKWYKWKWVKRKYTSSKKITLNYKQGKGSTATKYPIVLVPGVTGYSKIDFLDAALGEFNLLNIKSKFFTMAYFYRIADQIRKDTKQKVWDLSLHPWQKTEDRGKDMTVQILDFLMKNDPYFLTGGKLKVNLIAHSHGATTSRVAIAELAKFFIEADTWDKSGSRVASLTTVGGPHFGTPTAEGARLLDNNYTDDETGEVFMGKVVTKRVITLLKSAGVFFASYSGHNEYTGPVSGRGNWDKLLESQDAEGVLADFTQPGMYMFNKIYPSVGLPPGAKYVLSDQEIAYLNSIPVSAPGEKPVRYFKVDENDLVDKNDLEDGENIYDRAYGYGADTDANVRSFYVNGALRDFVIGDGLGHKLKINDPKAIQYYSFSGNGAWNTGSGSRSLAEIYDAVLLIFNSVHTLVGVEYKDWPQCVKDLSLDNLDTVNNSLKKIFQKKLSAISLPDLADTLELLTKQVAPLGRCMNDYIGTQGYTRDTDSFIPVDSNQFGITLGVYNWNHTDEINQLLGVLDPDIMWNIRNWDHPITVYRNHVNMLRDRGL